MKSRRQFLKSVGSGALAISAVPILSYASQSEASESIKDSFSLGLAGFNFRAFSIDDSIKMINRLGINNLSLKEFHLPLNSTQTQIVDTIGKFGNAGINIYTVGVIYMKTEASVDQAFNYAKMAGVNMIVGAP